MKNKLAGILVSICMTIALIGCGNAEADSQLNSTDKVSNEDLAEKYDASIIALSDEQIMVDGKNISTSASDAVYEANDIVFYLEGQDFTYGEGTEKDGHSQEESDAHTVVHITEPGNYVVSGRLSAGQIAVDLGEDAKKDVNAVVTLILNNADITCSVAPGVIFYDVYECSDDDEEDAKKDVDTSAAGANIIIADNSVNQVNGSYVAKIYESVELNEAGTEVVDSKKLHKYDAAFYSKRTMNIDGEENGTGVLNIQAENEGLGSELHLTINGGTININSGNDGINTNEDGVSVTTINGGSLNIVVNGSTGEGDGIDSNGWLVINGGNVTAFACGDSMDAGIDSDKGIHINGGNVAATGNMLDEIAKSNQTYAVFAFTKSVKGGSTITIENEAEEVISEHTPENDFSFLIISTENLTEGTYTIWKDEVQLEVSQMSGNMPGMMHGGMGRPGGERPQLPDGEMPMMPGGEPPQMPEGEMQQGTEYVIPEGDPMRNPDGEWLELEEMPEGMGVYGDRPWPAEREDGQNPENFADGHEQIQNAAPSMEFTITDGENMFMVSETEEN